LLAAADIARIINSDQVQAKLRAIKTSTIPTRTVNKNPLKNRTLLQKLNPYANTQRKLEAEAAKARSVTRKAALKLKRSKAGRAEKAVRTKRFNGLTAGLESSFQAAQKVIDDEIKAGLYNPNADAEDDE
jgi:large subunit ribosomal protein L4e